DGIMQTFAQNVEQLLSGAGTPQAATSPAPAGQPAGSATESAVGPSQGAVGPTGSASETASGDLDAWSLIIRPMLGRYARDVVTVGAAALAAYIGARAGARAGARSRRRPRCSN